MSNTEKPKDLTQGQFLALFIFLSLTGLLIGHLLGLELQPTGVWGLGGMILGGILIVGLEKFIAYKKKETN